MHARLLITILLFFGALTLWGFVNYLRGQAISGGYRGALAIGELLMLAQCIFLRVGQILRRCHHHRNGLVAIFLPHFFQYIKPG